MKNLQKLFTLLMMLLALSTSISSCDKDDDYSNVYGTYTGTLTITPDPESGYDTKTMSATLTLTKGTDGTFDCFFDGFRYELGDGDALAGFGFNDLPELYSGAFAKYSWTGTDPFEIITTSSYDAISMQGTYPYKAFSFDFTFTGTR